MILCLKCSGVLDKEFPANDSDDEIEIRHSVVSRALGLSEGAADEALDRLNRRGLIDDNYQPVNWDKRQFVTDSDPTAAERKRRQRLKERHGPVTRDSRSCHGPQITDTDTDTDTEKKKKSEGSRGSARTATRIPEGFSMTEERAAVARAERLDPSRTFAKFTDYWKAASGAKARKLDWEATWRNWCRTEADRGGRVKAPESTWEPTDEECGQC
jgi:hypothetical protein